MKRFELTRRALRDIQEIWEFVSEDNFEAADRVLEEFYRAFEQLATTPDMGHKRGDLTKRKVLFWPVRAYLVIYRNATPIQVVRVLHGKRNVKKLLG